MIAQKSPADYVLPTQSIDIECALCGEPWDAWGVYSYEDMMPAEVRRFLMGQGCPACKFGQDKQQVLPGGNLERFLSMLTEVWDE